MKYRVGFEDAHIKSTWSERMLYTDPYAHIVTGPMPPFAFGETVAVCPTRDHADKIAAAMNGANPEWSAEWPTEPGWYWFYGKTSRWAKEPRLLPTLVRRISNGVAYIVNGSFLYEEEGAQGKWAKMLEPPLPEVETT